MFPYFVGTNSMAPKEVKNHMKIEQMKLVPCKTVLKQAPMIDCRCRMQIKMFFDVDNHFYIHKNSCLEHCHHPHLKSEAILCGQQEMESGEIDLLMFLFNVNVSPIQISQMMELWKGPQAGAFTPKQMYSMKKKTEELQDFTVGLLSKSNDAVKTIQVGLVSYFDLSEFQNKAKVNSQSLTYLRKIYGRYAIAK